MSLTVATAQAEAGGLADHAAGWNSYGDYLAWQAAEGPTGKTPAYVAMSAGWAAGIQDGPGQRPHSDCRI